MSGALRAMLDNLAGRCFVDMKDAEAEAAGFKRVDACIADRCEATAVPPDGPFCSEHDWRNWRWRP